MLQAGLCSASANLLCDAGFEQSEPNGAFPDSGCWIKNALGFGGAGCTTTAARTGANGLWQYTGVADSHWKSQAYQDVPAVPGSRYFASAWVRTSFSGSSWVTGSRVFIKLEFLDSAETVLAEYSSKAITTGDSDWSLLSFATNAAPTRTWYARLTLYLEKPLSAGQTIVNFDDCIVREFECDDCITLDEIPACGESELLRGSVLEVEPDDYKVGVYLFLDDWWPKPTFAEPWTDINPDGTWDCNVATSKYDLDATEIMAFLVPSDEISDWPVDFSVEDGLSALPGEAFRFPGVGAFRPECFCEKIEFADFDWLIKDSSTRKVGPGPNYFTCGNVWVDASKYLHLKINKQLGQWYCAELFTEDVLGDGSYRFEVETGSITSLDPNVILGLFTWDEFAPHYTNREMDIEVGQWADPSADNAQYVIQPWNTPGHRHRFNIDPCDIDVVTFLMDWGLGRVTFKSFFGRTEPTDADDYIESWIYEANDVPLPGQQNARINLWLKDGGDPFVDGETEVVIRDFEFTPCTYDIAPASLDFSSVRISRSSTKVVTITNSGNCSPYFVTVEVTGTDANDFLVADRAFALQPGQDKEIDVTFIPSSEGDKEATLLITGDGRVVEVPLEGKGVRLEYTSVPTIGSPDFLKGIVSGVISSDYCVVSYILTDKWYIKPFYTGGGKRNPLRPINRKGDWKCNIDIEPTDKLATKVASYLIPESAAYPPPYLDSLADTRMSLYDRVSASKPKLGIVKIKAKARKIADDDSIVIDGRYHITIGEISQASQLCVAILQDDLALWSICVPFYSADFIRKNGFSYYDSQCYIKMKNFNDIENSFAGNIRVQLFHNDLTCLRSPMTLTVEVGEFSESATADEELDARIINGRKLIPLQFLSGCTDALRVDKVRLRKGSKSRPDSLYVKGAIVFKNDPPDLTEQSVTIGWGDDTFTVPVGGFTRASKTQPKYRCKKTSALQGGLVNAIFDLHKGSFWIKIKAEKLDNASDIVAFNLAAGSFSEGVTVEMGK